ncbi:RNA polymerase sigma factor [Aureibacter tunicatorum]|uniref:RNA polymerase sigma-70 factor (ECF subfamily) n=1 Tax=Aureibacter tunicatorum TaxID=866807 RepID=A0AAE3XRR9_9BACT|nr:RNA polymerase sigma factor [Aureibacter tunicatorum]MDR6241417.1 RNA polymerase sigma-70 factor (ECF subfamily) [Aureibacter tunicatorum]BDD06738.1 RNA polymerase sigma factor [Aureibacter tunicatorum]
MEQTTDEMLMLKVKQGDLDQMKLIFERHHLKLFRFLYRLTGDKTLSEDMTQTVFYRILRYRHSYKEGQSVNAWLYQIGRNVFYDHCERVKKNYEIQDESSIPDSQSQNGTGMEAEELNEQLMLAINSLDKEHKEILVMSKFQEMRYEDISLRTGMSVSNIKTRVYRAMKELKSVFFKLNEAG